MTRAWPPFLTEPSNREGKPLIRRRAGALLLCGYPRRYPRGFGRDVGLFGGVAAHGGSEARPGELAQVAGAALGRGLAQLFDRQLARLAHGGILLSVGSCPEPRAEPG